MDGKDEAQPYTISAEAKEFLESVDIREVDKGKVVDGKFVQMTPKDGGKRMVRGTAHGEP